MLICTKALDSYSFTTDLSLIPLVDKHIERQGKCLKALAVIFYFTQPVFMDITLRGRFTSRILADYQAFKEAEVLKFFLRKVVGLLLFGSFWLVGCFVWCAFFNLCVFKWKKIAGEICWQVNNAMKVQNIIKLTNSLH